MASLSLEELARRRIDPYRALDIVKNATVERRPFSFVRQNDGEAIILGAGRDVPDESVKFILHHWWKKDVIDWSLVEELRSGLLDSAASADILGFFDDCDGAREKYRLAGRLLRKYGEFSEECRFVSPEVHYVWQKENLVKFVLQGLNKIIVISNYDLSDDIARHFDIANVVWIPIPGHARYTDPRRQGYHHYPNRFREIELLIKQIPAGEIVIVGAGVLGKLYCHWIKAGGSIALDLGSVFDFWASNRGRRSVRVGASRVGF